jgi:putative transposase
MKKSKSLYYGHRFPAGVISCAVRWYFRFQLSLRDIEELLLERGVVVTYETIRCWCDKFGVGFAHRVKAARRKENVHFGGVAALRSRMIDVGQ